MMLFVVFILFSIILSTQQINIQNPKTKPQPQEYKDSNSTNNKNHPTIKIDTRIKTEINKNVTSTSITLNRTANNDPAQGLPKINETLEEKTIEIEPGAVTRGIIVFVGIALLFICYVGMKTYRRKKQDKSRILIRKYGVRTSRSDVEMEPLPLSDEEEDETVFDLVASRNSAGH